MGNWLDALREQPWLVWVALALVLGILEVTSLDLVFLMLAGGALAGAAAAGLGAPVAGQVAVALAAAVLLAATARPMLLRRLRMPPVGTTGTAALIGRSAVVVEEVGPRGGLVKLAGETWSARSATGAVFPAGRDLVVTAIDGATAVVGPVSPAVPDVRPAPPRKPEEI